MFGPEFADEFIRNYGDTFILAEDVPYDDAENWETDYVGCGLEDCGLVVKGNDIIAPKGAKMKIMEISPQGWPSISINGSSEWIDFAGDPFKVKLSLSEAKEETDIWDDMYDELGMDNAHEARHRKISTSEMPNRERFRFDDEIEFDKNDGSDTSGHKDLRNAYPTDDGFKLICKNDKQKEFAKKVAKIYGQRYDENGNTIIIHIGGSLREGGKDLSKVKGSMTNILIDDDGWKIASTSQEVYDYIKALFEERGLDTEASRNLLSKLNRIKYLDDSLALVYNSILKGSNMGSIDSQREWS